MINHKHMPKNTRQNDKTVPAATAHFKPKKDAFIHDRAVGVLVGTAVGDALGAGYEYGSASNKGEIKMIGGGLGNFAPGEWTDDTSMALMIAEVGASGVDFGELATLDEIAENFVRWYDSRPPDIGVQTRAILSSRDTSASAMRARAEKHTEFNKYTGGNGSLMRTAPVALATLDDADTCFFAAGAISDLTHYDERARQACQIWSLGIRHAVLKGDFAGVHAAVRRLDDESRVYWRDRLTEAQNGQPSDFSNNGWVVHALQTAWWAITSTGTTRSRTQHIEAALTACVKAGGDTDTTAAIAGGLLGAVYGVSQIKAEWRRNLHGWPGLDCHDLTVLALLSTMSGEKTLGSWPSFNNNDHPDYSIYQTGYSATHPHDNGVILGGYETIHAPVDAVVSLCRSGRATNAKEHIQFWLVDDDHTRNSNAKFVIDDAARTIYKLRAEGKTVSVHCVEGKSRTPSVAARYSVLLGKDPYAVRNKMPWAEPNPYLWNIAIRKS